MLRFDEEQGLDMIELVSGPPRLAGPKEQIVSSSDTIDHCYLVLEGVLCQYKLLANGDKQIVNLAMAGDICGFAPFAIERRKLHIETLSAVSLMPISTEALLQAAKKSSILDRFLWHQAYVDAAICREWMVNLGRRSAYQRVAHLLCEIEARLRAAGHDESELAGWSWRQADLGAAVGLSLVHVNKTLRRFQREGLVDWNRGKVRIRDIGRLRGLAGFDPDYLHLDQRDLGSLLLRSRAFGSTLSNVFKATDAKPDPRGACNGQRASNVASLGNE